MRWVVDTLVALMLVGMLAGMLMHRRSGISETELMNLTRAEIRRFQQQIMLQTALEPAALDGNPYPETVDPAWFDIDPPANHLLGTTHPWVEVAPPSHRHIEHPPDRAVLDPDAAQFWYNPNLGIVRGRVPWRTSDEDSLALYNYVNDTRLTRLYGDQ